LPPAVAPGGATIVTLVTLTFVTLVTRVLLTVVLLMVVLLTRMPTFTAGGALTITAGGVPIGAGTTMPKRDPGGGGTNTPGGPNGRGPGITPGACATTTSRSVGGGGMNTTPGAHQCPVTNTTTPSRCS
jgi:hypothetical protein